MTRVKNIWNSLISISINTIHPRHQLFMHFGDIHLCQKYPAKNDLHNGEGAMEKYRSSADPSTGIHPFITPKPPTSLLSKLSKPLLLLRLPFFLPLLITHSILSIVPALLSPLPFIAYPLRRLIDFVLLTPVLVCLSVWRPNTPTIERPRVRTDRSQIYVAPKRGDVIFANHASVLDILYLARAYSPIFAIPTNTDENLGAADRTSVYCVSLFQAISRVSCAPPDIAPSAGAVDITELAYAHAAPIVVLAEGCASNARGVLRFAVDMPTDGFPSPTRVFALALTYSSDRREVCIQGSLLSHVLRLLMLPAVTIRARVAAIPPDSTSVQKTVATLASLPALTVGREQGVKFQCHWLETTKACS